MNDPEIVEFEDCDLITPAEAVSRITGYLRSDMEARQILADSLHTGKITAYVDKVFIVEEFVPTDPWEDIIKLGELNAKSSALDRDCFRVSPTWPDETRFWDWDKGNLIVCTSDDPAVFYSGYLLEGVHLRQSEVMPIVGHSNRKGSGGPKTDLARWSEFWSRFIYELVGDRYDFVEEFNNRNQLRQMFLSVNEGMSQPFSGNSFEKAVEVAWEQLVVRQASERRARTGFDDWS